MTAPTTPLDAGVTLNEILPDVVERDALIERCRLLEFGVIQNGDVDQELMAAHRPGGTANSDTSATGWLSFFGQLHRWHAAGTNIQVPTAAPMTELDVHNLQEALHEKPQFVDLQDGTEKAVYPKGRYALDRVQILEVELRYTVARRTLVEVCLQRKETAGEAPTPADIETLGKLQELQQTLCREFLWIATHPGADVPWPDDGLREHAAPEWTRAHDGYDIEIVRDAFYAVNYRRLEGIVARTHTLAGKAESMSMEAFTSIMANDAGIPASRFAREWSYGMAAATAFLKWETTQKAEAAAKARANG